MLLGGFIHRELSQGNLMGTCRKFARTCWHRLTKKGVKHVSWTPRLRKNCLKKKRKDGVVATKTQLKKYWFSVRKTQAFGDHRVKDSFQKRRGWVARHRNPNLEIMFRSRKMEARKKKYAGKKKPEKTLKKADSFIGTSEKEAGG